MHTTHLLLLLLLPHILLPSLVALRLQNASQFPLGTDNLTTNLLHLPPDAPSISIQHTYALSPSTDLLLTGLATYIKGQPQHSLFREDARLLGSVNTSVHNVYGYIMRIRFEPTPNETASANEPAAGVHARVVWAFRTVPADATCVYTACVRGAGAVIAGRRAGLQAGVLVHVSLAGGYMASGVFPGRAFTYVACMNATYVAAVRVEAGQSVAYGDVDTGKRPVETGLAVAYVDVRSMRTGAVYVVSVGEGLAQGETFVRDVLWDSAYETDAARMYLSARRQTRIGFVSSHAPVLHAVSLGRDAVTVASRVLESELQQSMRVCVEEGVVHAGYVSRNDNKERVVVRRLTAALEDAGAVYRRDVAAEGEFLRNVVSLVESVACKSGVVWMGVRSAEVLYAENEALYERYRHLGNARVGVLAVDARGLVAIAQGQGAESVFVRDVHVADAAGGYFVAACVDSTRSGVVLVGKATFVPRAQVQPPAVANRTETGCIGTSTRVGARGIARVLAARADVRVQRHLAGRGGGKMRMLCRGMQAGGWLCATEGHVVRVDGRFMYMAEFCGAACVWRWEYGVNYKGGCGVYVAVGGGVQVSMHVARKGMTAAQVVRAECAERMGPWWAYLKWLVSTL